MALADSGRAIGAVSRLLRDHLIRRGFEVAIGKPENEDSVNDDPKLNLFLYETAFDPHLRNQPLHEGETPPLWLVLKFLLTAFAAGKNSDTESAHDLLGRGLAALHQLHYLPLDAPVPPDVRLALEHNPEPLKITFDESNAEIVSKVMQGTDERYRLSVAFQVRPVLIVPGGLPRGALLVGVDYTTAPETVIGRDGVQLGVIPTLGPRLARLEPDRFEAGAALSVFGDDLSGDLEVMLGGVRLIVTQAAPGRMAVTAEGSPGTPIASGTALSAGELPLLVRRRLSPTRTRSSNLLVARLLPTVTDATVAGTNLDIAGTLLGGVNDDVVALLCRESDGATVRLFDTFTHAADQKTLVVTNAFTGIAPGAYRLILRVNDQQARASPRVVLP